MTWNEVHTLYDPGSKSWVNKLDGRVIDSPHVAEGTAIAAGRRLAARNAADHWIHSPDGGVRAVNKFEAFAR